MKIEKIIEELLLERDAEMVHYSTEEAIKSHKERCDYLIGLLDKQEQGLLIELPCKVGDTVYIIAPNHMNCKEPCEDFDGEEYLVTWCEKYCPHGYKGIGIISDIVNGFCKRNSDFYVITENNGYRNTKNFFLTRSEAEEALAKMGE